MPQRTPCADLAQQRDATRALLARVLPVLLDAVPYEHTDLKQAIREALADEEALATKAQADRAAEAD